MFSHERTPDNVLDAVEQAITRLIAERIERDPDVSDTYLRVRFVNHKFTISILYIWEHFDELQDEDVPLLDLMIDRNDCEGMEAWEPDASAIHDFVQSFRDITTIDFCLN